MHARAKKIIIGALILFAVGALYALFVSLTHIGIPCVFNLITGLKCPGCGVSRMCLALIRFDFKTAFHENAAIFCMLPLMAATAARFIYVYIRYDRRRDKYAEFAVYFMIAVLVLFGVLRNIPQIGLI